MKHSYVFVTLLFLAAGAVAQEIDDAVVSPRYDYEPASGTRGSFSAYATGAVEGSYYYLLTTNTYIYHLPASAFPNGQCWYFDTANQAEHRIGEQVVGYRGTNSFAFLQNTHPPRFERFRTVSPCFDGRFGEQTEQQHRTWAYGGGPTIVSAIKNKAYLIVNRTRLRKTPTSTNPYELASNGANWESGDFDQILIGARSSLNTALTTSTSSSLKCRGQLSPPAGETCNSAFEWKLTPIVKITDNLLDPQDGQAKTFTALPPVVAEVNSATASLPIFSGIASNAVLFGFMEFGNICVTWNTSTNPPVCTQSGLPSRLAAVYITDTSATVQPNSARLYFKKGSSWIPMNLDGTFPTVPDDFSGPLGGIHSISDIKYNPVTATWNFWTDEWFLTDLDNNNVTDPGIPGCEHPLSNPDYGSRLVSVNLTNHQKITFWPSRNEFGRNNAIAHYVFAPACNCIREFIFYTSTDYVCYNDAARWDGGLRGWEITVRRWLDGAPSQ